MLKQNFLLSTGTSIVAQCCWIEKEALKMHKCYKIRFYQIFYICTVSLFNYFNLNAIIDIYLLLARIQVKIQPRVCLNTLCLSCIQQSSHFLTETAMLNNARILHHAFIIIISTLHQIIHYILNLVRLLTYPNFAVLYVIPNILRNAVICEHILISRIYCDRHIRQLCISVEIVDNYIDILCCQFMLVGWLVCFFKKSGNLLYGCLNDYVFCSQFINLKIFKKKNYVGIFSYLLIREKSRKTKSNVETRQVQLVKCKHNSVYFNSVVDIIYLSFVRQYKYWSNTWFIEQKLSIFMHTAFLYGDIFTNINFKQLTIFQQFLAFVQCTYIQLQIYIQAMFFLYYILQSSQGQINFGYVGCSAHP
eukprot:TRINITY_DN5520_c0_g1_i1.p1 TRINITY_DN5520_c0_g1~~TRINITY_DN5520_c0_g1_i1.p1  ORF type:complete len:362 (+),score=-33.23 TRINITY_DN5520_c0_g1_i1:154-1239(+)